MRHVIVPSLGMQISLRLLQLHCAVASWRRVSARPETGRRSSSARYSDRNRAARCLHPTQIKFEHLPCQASTPLMQGALRQPRSDTLARGIEIACRDRPLVQSR
jgi:hypothetical protein